MKKDEMLDRWSNLQENLPILPHFSPLEKPEGSTFGACGIRIDGNPAFIDAVLIRIKDLIDGENHVTRLACSYQPAVTGFKAAPNAEPNAHVCYIRLHMRGTEGAIASTVFNRNLNGAMDRYQAALDL
jgi:hypothetical protein